MTGLVIREGPKRRLARPWAHEHAQRVHPGETGPLEGLAATTALFQLRPR